MAEKADLRIEPSELAPRVVGTEAAGSNPETAARAIRRYLERRRPALLNMVEVGAEEGSLVVKAEGETPEQTLKEVRELLRLDEDLTPVGKIEVDAEEFVLKDTETEVDSWTETEILRSRARYFPHPTCEWFEVCTGELTLTEERVRFEPEYEMVGDETGGRSEQVILLERITEVRRGDWLEVPCLELVTRRQVYRYGWPARRGEPGTILDVDEWITHLRTLFARRASETS